MGSRVGTPRGLEKWGEGLFPGIEEGEAEGEEG